MLNMMQLQLAHIRLNAPPSVPPGQLRVDTFTEVQLKTTAENPAQPPPPPAPEPISQEQFQQDIKEFAQDIVIKQQQVEALVANLPGLNVSEEQQVQRMKKLERELEDLERERVVAVKEREVLLKMVEGKIVGIGMVG
jgi:mediator of RNA polymerase II transcription subunit 21